MESLGGVYKGVFHMGLIGSLSPALQKHKYERYFKKDVENPNTVSHKNCIIVFFLLLLQANEPGIILSN